MFSLKTYEGQLPSMGCKHTPLMSNTTHFPGPPGTPLPATHRLSSCSHPRGCISAQGPQLQLQGHGAHAQGGAPTAVCAM